MLENILIISGILLACYIILFVVSLRLKDNSIVDIFWGIGFVIIAALSFILYSQSYTSQVIMTLLIFAWGIRLFLSIGAKKLPYNGKEDARYARWRKSWKYFKARSFLQVYLFQGLLMGIIALPIFILNLSSGFEENTTLTLLGGTIALSGLLYEARADAELAGFIKNKKSGDILTEGLRKFSRYPQYFGESIFWFGIAIIASQVSVLGFIGWGVITLLVRYVSGVPLLEERYKGQKNYEEYSKITPIFFPDFSKIVFKK